MIFNSVKHWAGKGIERKPFVDVTCDLAPGVIGVPGLLRSQMNISESLAPDANRLPWNGLKSNAFTAPVC